MNNHKQAPQQGALGSYVPRSGSTFTYLASLLLFVFLTAGSVNAQNIRIVEVNPTNEWVTIKNFGTNTIDISNYWLCQRPQYDQLGEAGSISVVSGDFMLDPGEEVVINVSPSGQSGGFTAIVDLPENGELGLFTEANFGSTDPAIYLDFVTWGGETSPTRAGQAVTAGRWDDAASFVAGNAPFTYIGGANDVGAIYWEGAQGEVDAIVRIVEVNPTNEWVTIKNFGTDTVDISNYWLCQRPQYDQLGEAGSIAIVSGDFMLGPGEEVIINVSPAGQSGGFSAIVDLPENGELGLFTEANFGSTDPAIYLDFVTWGGETSPTRAGQAVEAGRWDDAASFVAGAAPYTYLGDADDVGAGFWVGDTEIRITLINAKNDIVVLENVDEVALDISSFFFCTQAGIYPQLGNPDQVDIVEGDLYLEPGERVAVRVLTEGGVVDENGTLFLFSTNVLGFNNSNPASLRDFAQWDAPNGFRVDNAVAAGRWDNAADYIAGLEPYFVYPVAAGEFGITVWNARTATVRLVRIDPANDQVTLKNFGAYPVDLTGYFFCLNVGQYEEITGDNLLLEPGEELTVTVQTGLDVTGPDNIGLFSTNVFRSTNPDIYIDFAQWGGRDDQGRPGQAVFAGIWEDADAFIAGAAPYEFIAGIDYFGSDNWVSAQNEAVFNLIDAHADAPISGFDPIEDGATINLALLPTRSLNIEADFGTADISKVTFVLNGHEVRTEGVAPFALFGDEKGDFAGGKLEVGSVELTAIPFMDGIQGTPATIRFEVIDVDNRALTVKTFRLVDAHTDAELFEIRDGDVIPASKVPSSANIVAITTDDVRSVAFEFNGSYKRVENVVPFALFGDEKGDFAGRHLGSGSFSLTATPFSEVRTGGQTGHALSIHFTIDGANSASSTQITGSSEEQVEIASSIPNEFELETNYPNPFNPETTIAFSLPQNAHVRLTIFNMLGQQVATLVDDALSAGRHEVRFQANDLPSGTYLYRLVTPSQTIVKKMLLLK